MKGKAAAGITLVLFLMVVLIFVFNSYPVTATTGTVCIRAEGTVDPPSAPIQWVFIGGFGL